MEVWWPPIKVNFTPFINMTLRVFEAFSGVGSQRMALRNLGIDHEVVAIAEIDKFAIKSYEAIHGETNNLGDISQLSMEDIPDHDLFTYSFPCQDISVAGQGLGLDEGSGTRSGLLWECQKVIAGKKPKYLLLENVKNLVGKKHKHNFDKWLEWLEEQGYTNYHQILNAKDYGIPQNRERVFVVSILGEHEPYEFPEPIESELRLKDVLESEVDEKFYLSQKIQDRLTINLNFKNEIKTIGSTKGKENTRSGQRDVVYSDEGIMGALSATDYKQPKQILDNKIKQIGQYDTENRKNKSVYRVYDSQGISPTLSTMQGGGRQPHVTETTKGYKTTLESQTNSTHFLIGSTQKNAGITDGDYSTTLTGSMGTGGGHVPMHNVTPDFRIRKLTPKECWRLMGFSDDDFHKAEAVNSNTQLYKQAGNSIVVDVLEGIFKQLLEVAE